MDKEQKTDAVRFGGFLVSLLLILVAVRWFVRGELVMSGKGVFLFGAHARITSALWIIVNIGLATYPFVRLKSAHSRAGATLLVLGLLLGVVITGFIASRLPASAALLIGFASSVLLSSPGLIVCGVAAEGKRQEQMNRSAEHPAGG